MKELHYYPFDINKFNSATRHMTLLERGIYRELMDMYYDTEKPLPDDIDFLCRKLCARTNDERTAVEQVLNECFTLTKKGWDNSKCADIVRDYKKQKANASKAGKASAKARKANSIKGCRESTPVERPLNARCHSVEPIKTINQNYKSELPKESANKFTDDDMKCAEYINSLIDYKTNKRPNLNNWADTIRLMRERDGLDHRMICEVFKWANQDSFWSSNIRSPAKLRDKFETLAQQMSRPVKQAGQTEQEFQDQVAAVQAMVFGDDEAIEGEIIDE